MPDQRVPPAGSPATANRAHARTTALDSSGGGATPCNNNNNSSSGNTDPNPSSSSSSSSSTSQSSLSTPTPQPRAPPPPPRRLRISPVIIVLLLLLSALAVAVLSALLPVLWFAIWGSTTTAAEVLVSHSEVVPALSDIGGGGGELSISSSLGRGGNSGCVLASSSSSSFLSFLSAASSSSSSSSLPFSSASSSSSSSSLSSSSPPPSTTAPLSPSCSSSSSSSSLASLDYSRSSPPPSPPPSPSTSAASQSQPQSPQSSENPPIVKQHYSNNVNANTDNTNNNNNDNDSPHPHPHHNNHIHHNNNHNASSAMTSTSVIVAATAHDDLNHVPTLPPTTSLSYLAEGAANVIYRLSSPPGAPQFPGQLLRLRKALPSAQPNKLAYAHLLHTFHPLFPNHLLLPTSLIRIPASLLARENTALHALEAANKRPAKRVGLYLEEVDEQFGFLIMDMSPHPLTTPPSSPSPPSLASPPSSPGFFARMLSFLPGRLRRRTASSSSNSSSSSSSSSSKRTSSSSSAGSASSSSDPDLSLPAHAQRTRQLLIEFKPKWVLQSRSAPDGWRRCRTCALRLSKHQKLGFCPLDLASGDEARVRRAVAHIVPARAPKNLVLGPGMSWEATQAVICERLVRYVLEGDLMVELKRLHSELDPYGPVAAQGMGREVRERFVSAMTVRDLTIFLRIDLERGEGEAGAVEARIGDLDLKTGEAGKWAYWAGVEAKLREEGYYGGTEEGAEDKGVWCRL